VGSRLTLRDGQGRPVEDQRVTMGTPINPATTNNFASDDDAVDFTASAFTITTEPAGTPAPTSAWVNFEITTTVPVNFLTFEMSISAEPGATGLTSVYVDGARSGRIDQALVLPGMRPYSFPTSGELAPGNHIVSFRLDPHNTAGTTITVRNLATGFGEFVPAGCAADFDQDGDFDSDDVVGFFAAWDAGESGADADSDGDTDSDDIVEFFEKWEQGSC